MAKTNFQSVDDYISTQPVAVRPILEKVRKAIRSAAPKAEERISYQIAGYRLHDGVLIFFAGWKDHYGIYPATQPLLEAFAKELTQFEVRGNTIRFSYEAPVPVGLIRKLVQFRAAEAAEVAAHRAARKAVRKVLKRVTKKSAQKTTKKRVAKKRVAKAVGGAKAPATKKKR